MATLFDPDTKLKDDILQLSHSGNPVPPKVALLQLFRIGFPHEDTNPRVFCNYMGMEEYCFPCVLRVACKPEEPRVQMPRH